eukprot:763849-Hanusia_phi.AAC.2
MFHQVSKFQKFDLFLQARPDKEGHAVRGSGMSGGRALEPGFVRDLGCEWVRPGRADLLCATHVTQVPPSLSPPHPRKHATGSHEELEDRQAKSYASRCMSTILSDRSGQSKAVPSPLMGSTESRGRREASVADKQTFSSTAKKRTTRKTRRESVKSNRKDDTAWTNRSDETAWTSRSDETASTKVEQARELLLRESKSRRAKEFATPTLIFNL